jgi:Ion channel
VTQAALVVLPIRILRLWQIALLAGALAHEREHPALALLLLAPANHFLFSLTATLYPHSSLHPVSSRRQASWVERSVFAPVAPFSRAWALRLAFIVVLCVAATLGLIEWYGSAQALRSTLKLSSASAWVIVGVLLGFSYLLYGPLWTAFKRFAVASGLADPRPWKALAIGMGVWVWSDAVFAALYQQLAFLCAAQADICGGKSAFSEPLTSFPTALYFSTITLGTVGFGDVLPVAPIARALVTCEVAVGIGLLGFILGRVATFAPAADKKPTEHS